MCDQLSQFVVDKYVHLKEFLAKESCAELTAELKRLVAEKQTVQDSQCPKSEAIHGAMAFDKLLVDLLPHFERASGKRLYPTYSYARLYAPGEDLTIHTDRPSCEISATLTLGFEGDVWPIYMGDEGKANASKIDMAVGDAVLYRGMDKHHWREEYTEGKWQAQVFLHYVDKNGKYADWKYDKRDALGISKTEVEKEKCFARPTRPHHSKNLRQMSHLWVFGIAIHQLRKPKLLEPFPDDCFGGFRHWQ